MTEDQLEAFCRKYNLVEQPTLYSYDLYKNKVQIGMIFKRLGINHADGSLYRYFGITFFKSKSEETTLYDFDECCKEFENNTLKFYKREYERMKMNNIQEDFE